MQTAIPGSPVPSVIKAKPPRFWAREYHTAKHVYGVWDGCRNCYRLRRLGLAEAMKQAKKLNNKWREVEG